jgi:DNA-binding Lrp family transcriptional regulator
MTRKLGNVDQLDRLILKVLAEDPRAPYSDIAEEIAEEGYEMSSEGVRYRVSKLMNQTSIFFLLAPSEHEWEIVRMAVSVSDDPDAKSEALDAISEMPFWLVCRGVGSFDIYAAGTAPSNVEVDALIRDVRELEQVIDVSYSVETERDTNVNDYLSPEQLSSPD